MLSTAYYFLQVIVCSAIMMGYYWIALRNKKFHQYNRFYLLAVVLFSWTVPLIKIQWPATYTNRQQVIHFLSVVADNNSEMEAIVGSRGFHWSMERIAGLAYLLTAAVLFLFLIRAFYRIYVLLKTNSCRQVGDILLIITRAKGTPFSFFRYIFWNEEIDIRSASGKQILQHELTHVQQKHSVDKLLIQLMLIPGWFNPFFWLLKKEMDMIHEFIADKKAVQDGDTAALAQMLLTAVYPKHRFDLTHPFFFSPIKRRLQMLTNHTNPRFSYIRRLVILPLLAVVIVLFAFRSKEYRAKHPISVKNVLESVINDVQASQQTGVTIKDIDLDNMAPMRLSKTYRIVINPGHGGTDLGARGADGTTESALTLELAKKLKEKNTNPQLDIVLTRNADEFHTVMQVAEKTNTLSPDLFVSIHVNSAAPIRKNGKTIGYSQQKGAEIFVADKAKAFDYEKSYQLANWIGNFINQSGTSFKGIKSRSKGIYVLQAVKCPAVLVETGYITHREEAALLKSTAYQEKMASAILHACEQYLLSAEKNPGITITDIDLEDLNGTAVNSNGNTNTKEVITPDHPYFRFSEKYKPADGVLYLLDGEPISYDQLNDIPVNTIRKIDVIKDPASVKIVTSEDVKEVVLITTRQSADFKARNASQVNDEPGKASTIHFAANADESGNAVIQQQEPVSFPGGEAGWRAYLERNLNLDVPVNNGADTGTYKVHVSFTVDKTGKLSNIKVEKDPGYGTAAEVVRILSKGPNWNPATVNGKPVTSRFVKTVTFKVSDGAEEPVQTVQVKDVVLEAIYRKTDEPPYFPGGMAAWTKYLERNLDKDIVKRKGGPKGKYTVTLTFVVDEKGRITSIGSNDPGYGTREEAVRIIEKGPNWKPAINKGKPVKAEHKLSITFVHA